eukprot:11312169-Alexandrium_andersonii.AAC.1
MPSVVARSHVAVQEAEQALEESLLPGLRRNTAVAWQPVCQGHQPDQEGAHRGVADWQVGRPELYEEQL